MAEDQLPDEFAEGFADAPVEDTGEAEVAEPSYFLRDLSEDDVYSRLNQVNELPSHISGLESRFTGNLNQFSGRLEQLEKSLASRTAFDGSKLQSVLEAYDPKLAEVLIPALQEALQTAPLDENLLRPYLEPMQDQTRGWMGEQLVMAVYPPETLAEIIPPVKDGRFAPEGQRHKDFIEWYSQQGYQMQQALLSFGAPYVNALRRFEAWEQGKNKERTAAAAGKTARLQSGQVPAAQNKRSRGTGPQTAEDLFLAAFNEASSEGR